MGKIHVVTCEKGAEKVVQRIMLGEPIIGLACTGVAVGPKGNVAMMRQLFVLYVCTYWLGYF